MSAERKGFEQKNEYNLERVFAELKRGSVYPTQIDWQRKNAAADYDTHYADQTCSFLLYRDIAEMTPEELKYRKFVIEEIRGKVLVDLGGGMDSQMFTVAQEAGAESYINVDVNFQRDFKGNQLKYDPLEKASRSDPLMYEQATKLAEVKSDMLDFASRLPDSSVIYTISGIDFSIIGANPEYNKALAKEIYRTTVSKGLVFGNEFRPISEYFPKNQFRHIFGTFPNYIQIYQKAT